MVLRSASSKVMFWALAVLVAVFVADAVLRADWALIARTAAVFGFGLWVAWVLLYRMSIRISDDGVTVTNVLRRTHIPWSRVRGITRRVQIRIAFFDSMPGAGDREIESWGSPSPKKSAARLGAAGVRGNRTESQHETSDQAGETAERQRDLSEQQRDPALYALRAAWRRAGGLALEVDGDVNRSLDLPALAVGLVLLAGTIVVNIAL